MRRLRKKTYKISRGRGVNRGGGPVHLRVGRVMPEQEAVLNRQGNRGGVYEDGMLFVRDQQVATRKRGRPKKFLPTAQPSNVAPEVIYVSSMNEYPQRLVPLVTTSHRNRTNHLQGMNVGSRQQVRHSISCVPFQAPPQLKNKPVSAVGAYRNDSDDSKQGEKIIWPDDLKELVETWDTLPESKIREVVKWFQTPLQAGNLPSLVTQVHNLRECNMGAGAYSKPQNVGSWLRDDSNPQQQAATAEPPPKVVVQIQPTSLQECGQWSSMAENQENCAP